MRSHADSAGSVVLEVVVNSDVKHLFKSNVFFPYMLYLTDSTFNTPIAAAEVIIWNMIWNPIENNSCLNRLQFLPAGMQVSLAGLHLF